MFLNDKKNSHCGKKYLPLDARYFTEIYISLYHMGYGV